MSPHDNASVYRIKHPVVCVNSRHTVVNITHTLISTVKAFILLLHHKQKCPPCTHLRCWLNVKEGSSSRKAHPLHRTLQQLTAYLLNLELLLHIQGLQLPNVCKETVLRIFAVFCDTAIKRLVLSSAQQHCCVSTHDAFDLSLTIRPVVLEMPAHGRIICAKVLFMSQAWS